MPLPDPSADIMHGGYHSKALSRVGVVILVVLVLLYAKWQWDNDPSRNCHTYDSTNGVCYDGEPPY